MANLETLELTINANAQSARQGVQNLISSLSSLATQVQDAFNKLSSLNAELRRLAGLGGSVGKIKLPSVSTTTGARRVSSSARQRMFPAEGMLANPRQLPQGAKAYMADGRVLQFVRNETEAQRAMAAATNDAAKATKNEAFSFKQIGKSLKDVIPKFTLFHKIARLASTMLLRMGLRAAFKGIKEGFDNYYQYAKANNLVYAQQMDQVSSSLAQLKNQAGASLASALSAALPVLNAIASAAINAFNALSQLFALLTGKNSWSKATQQATEYGDATKKAGGSGGGLKEQLAAFDELNVIASESGGGGGGATKAAEDFTTMFEESFEFDKNIEAAANLLKQAFEDIRDNALLIGAIILGWKVGQAFGGLVGELGKWIALGAAITLGLKLTYEFGEKIGSGEELNGLDLLEGIGGAVATMVGGTLVGFKMGGPWGALAGAVISTIVVLSVGLKGYIDGSNEKFLNSLWGSTDLNPEEIKEYVRQMYTFDIEAEINLLNPKIEMVQSYKRDMDEAITRLNASLKKVELGIETDTSALANDALDVINKTKSYFEENRELYKLYIALAPETIDTNELITAATPGEDILTQMGKDISNIINEAVKSGWDDQKNELIQYYAEYINDVMGGAEQKRQQLQLQASSVAGLNGFTRGTAQGIFEQQKEWETEYKNTIRAAQETIAAGKISEASLNYEIAEKGYKYENGKKIEFSDEERAEMKKQADALVKEAKGILADTDNYVEGKLAESRAGYTAEWKKALIGAYGGEKGWAGGSTLGEVDIEGNRTLGLDSAFFKDLDGNLTADSIRGRLSALMEQFDPMLFEISDYFGFTGWDVMEDEQKKNLVTALTNTFGSESISTIMEAFDLDASELVQFTNWDEMTRDNKKEFIKGMKDVFGDKKTISTILNKDYWSTLSDEVKEEILIGLKGIATNDEIKEIAEEIGIDIADNLARANEKKFKEDFEKMKKDFGIFGDTMQTIIDEHWDWVAPVIDTYGAENSMTLFKYALSVFGEDTSEIIKNWDLVAGDIDMSNYKESLNNIKLLADNTKTEVGIVMANFSTLKPTIDDVGITKACTYIKELAQTTGQSTEEIIKNWNLHAPYVKDENYRKSYKDIIDMSEKTGIGIQDILDKWDLIAPYINSEGYNTALYYMKGIASGLGIEIQDVLDNWDLIAPLIDEYNFSDTLSALKTLTNGTGLDLATLLKNWDLIAPFIDKKNVTSSAETISELIKGYGNDWQKQLPKLIVKLGLDATTAEAEVPNIRQTIIDSFGNKILIPVGLTSDGSSLKTTVSGSGTSKTVTLTKQQASKTAVAIYATGAYDIGAGDLFIANERGAEMVGSINGKSSVANQQQIVEGIASGVASANAEQNSLLREQNSLLRGILEKEASVKFGASAALGRTVRQSLDMYGAVSGV